MIAEVRLACDPSSVGRARRFVADVLANHPLELRDAATLMVSELATNAVQHAKTDFSVLVVYITELVRVEVRDGGDALPVMRRVELPTRDGRGLLIVRSMADDFGMERTERGNLVWFTLSSRCGADLSR